MYLWKLKHAEHLQQCSTCIQKENKWETWYINTNEGFITVQGKRGKLN